MKIVHTNLKGILLINWTMTKKSLTDISLDEISKYKIIKILKPNKSPGEDGVILEFYQLYWQGIKANYLNCVKTFPKSNLP